MSEIGKVEKLITQREEAAGSSPPQAPNKSLRLQLTARERILEEGALCKLASACVYSTRLMWCHLEVQCTHETAAGYWNRLCLFLDVDYAYLVDKIFTASRTRFCTSYFRSDTASSCAAEWTMVAHAQYHRTSRSGSTTGRQRGWFTSIYRIIQECRTAIDVSSGLCPKVLEINQSAKVRTFNRVETLNLFVTRTNTYSNSDVVFNNRPKFS